jgi:hypothetical protein
MSVVDLSVYKKFHLSENEIEHVCAVNNALWNFVHSIREMKKNCEFRMIDEIEVNMNLEDKGTIEFFAAAIEFVKTNIDTAHIEERENME